jgi:outer membrane protein OmpA-like peptidoglycan-associated protein
MTEPGSAPPARGATDRPLSPARLVLAAGLLALGIADLAVINLVLLPRALATAGPCPGRFTPLPTATVPPGGSVAPLPAPSPPRLDGATPSRDGAAPVAPLPAERQAPSQPPAAALPAVGAFPDLQFALNATWLSPASRETLGQVADALAQNPERRAVLRGHTDRMGPPELNRWLALERARRAGRYLKARGIEPTRIEVQSFADKRPAEANATPAAQARNRRVEIEVQ